MYKLGWCVLAGGNKNASMYSNMEAHTVIPFQVDRLSAKQRSTAIERSAGHQTARPRLDYFFFHVSFGARPITATTMSFPSRYSAFLGMTHAITMFDAPGIAVRR